MSVSGESLTTGDTVILMPVFTAKPGFEERLKGALSRLQVLSREDEGCIAYSVFVDQVVSERFVLYEEWTTRKALEIHNEQDHVRNFLALSAEWLARPLEVAELWAVGPREKTRH